MLLPHEKWLQYFNDASPIIDSTHLTSLLTYGKFVRGIATGANEYFALPMSTMRRMGMESYDVIPCITKSMQVQTRVFTESNFDDLVENDKPVFLLSTSNNMSAGLKKYIEEGEKMGYHKRPLTSHRKPWYKLEHRSPAPLWFGVFSRGGLKIIRNYTNVRTLTCFHGFVPNSLGEKYIDHLFLYLLSRTGKSLLSLNMRRYGNDLNKFEPSDINQAICPNVAWFDYMSSLDLNEEIAYVNDYGVISERAEAMFSCLVERSARSATVVRNEPSNDAKAEPREKE